LALLPLFVWHINRFQIGPEERALAAKFRAALQFTNLPFGYGYDGDVGPVCNKREAAMSVATATTCEDNFLEVHPYWTALVLAAATIPVFLVLSVPAGQQWAALLLALTGGVYVGFAARDGRLSANIFELIGALAFVGIGLLGLQFNPLLIAAGFVGHGFWDLFHHRHGVHASPPHWFIPLCVLYDWIIAVFLMIHWS
jgi:hypothetical protein